MSRDTVIPEPAAIVAGIFVGGRGSRMGGAAKGLLLGVERVTLIERWQALFGVLQIPVVLIGANDSYRRLSLPMLADDPANVGPLGGLAALLKHSQGRYAVAVACDMPWVSQPLLARLIDSEPSATVLAARHEGHWQPFFARYDAALVLPIVECCLATHRLALHEVLDDAEATELSLTDQETAELRDWDTPEDVKRDGVDFRLANA